jgi:hypothetical protein
MDDDEEPEISIFSQSYRICVIFIFKRFVELIIQMKEASINKARNVCVTPCVKSHHRC